MVNTEKTYSVSDLGKEDFGATPLAVLGHPVGHSISPAMHNAALARMREGSSRFKGWAYYRFDLAAEALSESLPLFHRHNFLGLNLTIPHKVEAVNLISLVSLDGQRMGAVNTLLWGKFGYSGFNTDGYGLKRALELDLGVYLKGADVLLLGAGGAARAAAVQCVLEGCSRLWIGNRTPERLSELSRILKEIRSETVVETFALNQLPEGIGDAGVVINATSLGLRAEDPAPIDVGCLAPGWRVFDMIYNPVETCLLREARERGLATANGLSMLVHQGARSLEIWSKASVDARSMLTAACHTLQIPPRYD